MFHLIAHRSPSSLIRSSRKLNTSISGSRSGGVETTRLPNGLTVASSAADMGHFATLGVYVNTGTRFETNDTLGLSYLMDRMAFKSTREFTADKLVQKIESMGGNVMAHSSRESIMYQAAVFHNHVPDTLHLLSSIVRNPLLLDAELDDVRTSSSYELNDMVHRPDMTVPELLHATAYRDIRNTIPSPSSAASPYPVTSLGRPMHCTLDRLSNVTPDILRAYRSTWFTPDRLVVASVGIPHTQFVEMVCKHFEDMPALLAESHAARQNCIDDIKYSGGVSIVDTSSMPPSPNPDDMPLTHVNIAFESLAMSDPDIYALATLASLLGGGGSFSAGGPGKGMYTRLYTEVLNRFYWVENCNTINFSYVDSGLFGISASIPPVLDAHRSILPIICDQLLQTTQTIRPIELSRAKNMLKSSLLMSLESKLVQVEDMGRQLLIHGTHLPVSEMCRRIDLLTADDLKRVARRVVLGENVESPLDFGDVNSKHWRRTGSGEPTVVVQGPLFARGGKEDPLWAPEKVLREWGVGKPILHKGGANNGLHAAGSNNNNSRKFWSFGRN